MNSTPPIVTLTTDFGTDSRYVAAIKGVILQYCPAATLVDITHAIEPQNIAQAARVVAHTTLWFPPHTLHLVVVDPGVGTDREIIYAEFGTHRYVCPDNGLLSCLAHSESPLRIVAITNPQYYQPRVSATFHGRDIMAPVVGQLAAGLDPMQLGPVRHTLHTITLPQAHQVGQKIAGEVVEVDSFGNLITNITDQQLASVPRGETTRVECDGHETFGIFATYGEQPEMTLVAVIGSSGQLELAIVGDSAAAMLGVRAGTAVSVVW